MNSPLFARSAYGSFALCSKDESGTASRTKPFTGNSWRYFSELRSVLDTTSIGAMHRIGVETSYAGQHSCMYESSCLFSLDSFGKEIKRPSASGNILALEYCGQIFCVPLGLTEKDKTEITKRFDKISFLVHGKQRRKKAIWNFLDSLYKYVNDTDMPKIVAVTTYKNMNQERKESKNGKELKKYLDTIVPAAILWYVFENDAEALKNLLDVCEIKQETLKNAYEMYGVDADIQVKAYLLDAIGKAKSDKETFDI